MAISGDDPPKTGRFASSGSQQTVLGPLAAAKVPIGAHEPIPLAARGCVTAG